MDAFDETPASDPAAEFLAREQEELGELGEELGIKHNLSVEDQEQIDEVNRDLNEMQLKDDQTDGENRNKTPSPAFVMPPRPKEEPETIRLWREQQSKRLEEKDAKEAEMMTKMREEAQQELKDWYKRYEENLDKTKKNNREDEKEFVAEVNDITPGTEWDRVTKLCDFSGKNANKNSAKDMTRMKSILLQLKQQQTTKNAS